MDKPKRKISGFFFLFLIICLTRIQFLESHTAPRIKITTSVFPLMEFANAVSGERGEVSLILPLGAEIHTWRPRPSDIIRLSSSNLFIYMGSDLEPWVHDVLKSVKNHSLRILEASQGLSLIEQETGDVQHDHELKHTHEHETLDPHIWLDLEKDQTIVDKIESILSEIDPDSSVLFKKNADIYKQRLRSLDKKFKMNLKDCPQRTFILGGHAAFGYLAKKYDLNQISLYGLNPDSKPTPKQMIKTIELAKEYNIKVIFFEKKKSGELAKILAKEIGARILTLNPGANLTREELKSGVTFIDIMEKNLENLKNGLGCN